MPAPTPLDIARGVASWYDAPHGVRIHQLSVLVEAHARSRGFSALGDGAVVARPDGHIIVAAVVEHIPYDWRYTHHDLTRLDQIPSLYTPITDVDSVNDETYAALIDNVVNSWSVDDSSLEQLDDHLDDRLRDHPSVIAPIRAARTAGSPVALDGGALAALSSWEPPPG